LTISAERSAASRDRHDLALVVMVGMELLRCVKSLGEGWLWLAKS
jgi:hypothetical protein